MTTGPCLLLIEDESDQRQLLQELLTLADYQVDACADLQQASDCLAKRVYDLILSDWKLQTGDGLAFFREQIQHKQDCAFILMTAYGDVSHAMQCLRIGLDDYLIKPFNKQQLLFALARSLQHRQLQQENSRLHADISQRHQLVDLIGAAPSMQQLYQRLDRIARSSATVLLTGESGTGKELAARAIHQLSARRDNPFAVLNCAAIPETLFEAELFGSEKGAYTGADRKLPGKVSAAEGGTLFLDEIGELPLSLQPKLLRLLQESSYQALGSNKECRADIRVIAATNRDLQEEVTQGRFRADLFYRLNIVPIRLPALRERQEDILLLARHFLKTFADKHQIPAPVLLPDAIKRLAQHPFVGNVRELRNVMERLLLLHDGHRVDASALEQYLQLDQQSSISLDYQLPAVGIDWEQHERSLLKQALEQADYNRTKAARLLSLSYKTFIYRLEKHQLIPAEKSDEQ